MSSLSVENALKSPLQQERAFKSHKIHT